MNKKFINGLLLVSLMLGNGMAFTSCEDYDDDISNLQSQIDTINADLSKLEAELASGKVITAVSETSTGVAITLSDGKVLNLTNGKDGANGAAGTTWTIGTDGYWYENGVKTDYVAIGEKGEKGDKGDTGATGATGAQGDKGDKGDKGDTGATGAQGEKGDYYVPEEDGYFYIYNAKGEKTKTDIRWMKEYDPISAVLNGRTLMLGNVQCGTDEDGNPILKTVELEMGAAVGSLAFIPSVMSVDVPMATTTNPFYHIANYISDAKPVSATDKHFATLNDWDKSNVVELGYRVNPSHAFLEGAEVAFVNRAVTSRAAGDNANLLNVVTTPLEEGVKYFENKNGEIYVNATINNRKASATANDIAALKLNVGTEVTVSDYVAVSSEAVTPVLLNTKNLATLYGRTKVINATSKEDDAFVKEFCSFSALNNFELVHNASLDLSGLVALYAYVDGEYTSLKDLGFTGISYEFSKPEKYMASDAQETNQQYFAKLDGSILKVSEALTSTVSAIGKTPVVRVDAMVADNNGTKQLIASSYIKVKIVEQPSTPVPTPDPLGDYTVVLDNSKVGLSHSYQLLTDQYVEIGSMNMERVTNAIYGHFGQSASTFWDQFGGASDEYTITVKHVKADGTLETIGTPSTQVAGTPGTFLGGGIKVYTSLDRTETNTMSLNVSINNQVRTQHTYANIDNKGAKYVVEIAIKADNNNARQNVVVKHEFYVDCNNFAFNLNSNWWRPSYAGFTNAVLTKGDIDGGTWKLFMKMSQAFELKGGKTIYEYYNAENNVAAIEFVDPTIAEPTLPVEMTTALDPITHTIVDQTLALTAALDKEGLGVKMKYINTLVNAERCNPNEFVVYFQNPFKVKTTGAAVELNTNAINATTDLYKSVVVKDLNNVDIYKLINNALGFTTEGQRYQVAAPTVSYEIVGDAYTQFKNNLSDGSLTINQTTGVLSYTGQTLTLANPVNATVVATVTFANLSVVKCEFPIVIR